MKLHDEGLIDYRPSRGVAASEMPRLISGADVLLDQFRIGSYGVAAVEAMFAGRVVVGHVSHKVRKIIREETGSQVPIVEATPETLETVLRDISKKHAEGKVIPRPVIDEKIGDIMNYMVLLEATLLESFLD